MVTHSSTSRPVQCLCMAERTGCPVFTDLWSYVSSRFAFCFIMLWACSRLNIPKRMTKWVILLYVYVGEQSWANTASLLVLCLSRGYFAIRRTLRSDHVVRNQSEAVMLFTPKLEELFMFIASSLDLRTWVLGWYAKTSPWPVGVRCSCAIHTTRTTRCGIVSRPEIILDNRCIASRLIHEWWMSASN